MISFRDPAAGPMSVELADIVGVLSRDYFPEPPVLAGSVPAGPVPARWRPIVESDDAETRRLLALSLWNREFLDLVPRFAQALRTELADVRVGHHRGQAVLVSAFAHVNGGERVVTCWIGWDPGSFGEVEVAESEPWDPEEFGVLLDELMMSYLS